MRKTLYYGEWLPDQADYENPGLTECKNVYPGSDGYSPFLSGTSTGLSVTGTVLGAKRFEKSDGTRVVVCGTDSDLFVIVGGASNASSLGLSLSTDDAWSFEQFGSTIYATAKTGATYSLGDVDSDTTFSAASGSPPKGEAMARIGDFLFMGNLTDIDTSDAPFRVRWSRFNNPGGNWASSISYQSGAVDMPTQYGVVTGVSGGNVGLVMQKYGVSRLQYTGGASVFRKDVIDQERGCASPSSIVRVGALTFWIAHDGFCASDGASVRLISPGRVWGWFRENAEMSQISKVQGAVDWPNRCVLWNFYGSGQAARTHVLAYNWVQDRWSHIETSADWLVESTQDGQTLEQVGATYSDIDAMTISLDSPIFASRGRILSGFIGGTLYDFNGNPLAASFETGDFQVSPTSRNFVSEAWPVVENSSLNSVFSIGTRERVGAAVSYGSDTALGPHGYAPVAADGRFFRVRHTIPAAANWDKAQGLQLTHRAAGLG